MYSSETLISKDRDLRTRKILLDVLKIDRDIDLKSENKNNTKISESLSSDMIKKVKKALQ
jgi:hypothetical protein